VGCRGDGGGSEKVAPCLTSTAVEMAYRRRILFTDTISDICKDPHQLFHHIFEKFS